MNLRFLIKTFIRNKFNLINGFIFIILLCCIFREILFNPKSLVKLFNSKLLSNDSGVKCMQSTIMREGTQKFHYDPNANLNCSEFDLMGRMEIHPRKLENKYEPRKWLIDSRLECQSDLGNVPLAIALISNLWSSFWRRKIVCFVFLEEVQETS